MHWLPVFFFLYFFVQPYSFSSVCGEVTAHDPQGHMLPHYEWVSDCGHIWYVRECEWEFVSCCPTLRMCASWSSHGHTLAIFKCRKRYCRSSLEVLVHEGQKGPGREPATQNVHVRAVRSYRNSRYNYKQIGGDFFFFAQQERNVSWSQWFSWSPCSRTTCPLHPGIPVVFSFPVDGAVEEEEGAAAALHRDVWDSNCNLWPLPQRQVSH